MASNKLNIIASRVFSITDQITFANFSGDFNPIHIDVISARRSLTGDCTVHGINALLWGLDRLVMKEATQFNSVDVEFLKPIFLHERVSCVWNRNEKVMTLESDGVILTSCKLKMAGALLKSNLGEITGKTPAAGPRNLTFKEASLIKKQPFNIFGNPELCFSLFPEIFRMFGSMVICEIAAISQVVGMECPGLNSLFATLKIEVCASKVSAHEFSVLKSNERFNYLELSVIGRSLKASAGVFYRPPKTMGLPVEECKKYVKEKEFSNVKALIIGGSRGLGELVAKLIACGGGESVITYNLGKDEAAEVVREIAAIGEKCAAIQHSIVGGSFDLSSLPPFNQVYYFATPKIASKRKNYRDEELEQKFIKFYVDEFYSFCQSLLPKNSATSIFYPSTTLIDQPEKGLEEYITAKLKGEEICRELNGKDFRIILERLPRMNTDQNISLLKLSKSNEIDVMMPIVRAMSQPS